MRTSLLLAALLCGCPSEPDTAPESAPYTGDAQFICDVFVDCFGVDVGEHCAGTIEDTTRPADITLCADCLDAHSCDEIGEPGTPGACDSDCNAAVFGVAP